MHESFFNYSRFRYAQYALAAALLCVVAYLTDARHERPRGDTVLGYTLGGIATALVLFLMCYGIRRRSFRSRTGSTKRWLSMHVYLGLCVVLVATLHSALQFGYNVHTLAYVLLCLVVLSGCWGVYAYLRYPALMSRERGEVAREKLLSRLAEADRQAIATAASARQEVRELIADAIRRTSLGGGVWRQLRGRDQSMLLVAPIGKRGYARLVSNRGQRTLIARLAEHQASSRDEQTRQTLLQLLQITGDRAVLVQRIQRDIQYQGLMQHWLAVHLPLSFALLAALAIHVFAVFYY
jgi:multisubunit Na+/H+ antiporter MnhB subunit